MVTPEQALNHPTWRMGNRITIDSATLMNKGFEVIEACWLFIRPVASGRGGTSAIERSCHDRIQRWQRARADFSDRHADADSIALDLPERCEAPVPKIDWAQARKWEFLPPDFDKFPLLKLAYECQEAGGSATCTLNAPATRSPSRLFCRGRSHSQVCPQRALCGSAGLDPQRTYAAPTRTAWSGRIRTGSLRCKTAISSRSFTEIADGSRRHPKLQLLDRDGDGFE